ncbi:MAG TPA: SMP-30/gluconolactonase/LRE family protein [Gaiellaceae bacterium]|nr:SMP-30/gluconolactonase/LRE family protein [Gaiellaceae bacterium]
MPVDVKSEKLTRLVDEAVEVERLGTGFTFTEGPIWHPRDEYLLFSDMPADIRRKWTPDGTVVEVMNPSNKCNGMTYDADLNLLVCEHSTSSVVRERPDGTRETLATHYQGKELNSPNDIIVHSSGAIYFSDPTYGRWPGFGIERDCELDFRGVYRLAPGGGDPELLVDDFGEPNGLSFSPDESLLYINDTPNALIRVFDVQPDGSIANGRLFADKIGDGDLAKGGLVDGMKADEQGNVWVTGPDGVWVFAPDGEHLGVVEIPESVGNIHWGGPNWNWMFVPASTSLYRFQTKVSGRREPFMQ